MSEVMECPIIEKGEAVSPSGRWQRILFNMEAGDSVVVEHPNERIAFLQSASRMGIIVSSRKISEGFRIWRAR